jgi:hypothetical protein
LIAVRPNAQALLDQLQERLQLLLDVARKSPVGGGPQWDAVLRSLSVRALTGEERAAYLATSTPLARGALPIEVRGALVALETSFRAALANVDRDDQARDPLERELRDFIERELRHYISAIRPSAGVSRIFQNARNTTTRYDKAGAGVSMMRCSICGASRANDAQAACSFCGTSFYGGTP